MSKIRYIALLRGINVGGKNLIKMSDLKESLSKTGLQNVRTYIASGNVVFDSSDDLSKVEKQVDKALENDFGYRGPTVVLSATDFEMIVNQAPTGFGEQPDKFHSDVIFLKLPTTPDVVLKDVLAMRLREGVDAATAGSKALYFTRLSAKRTSSRMGKIVGLASYKSMTIRNWNTTKKLLSLLRTED